MLVHCLQRNLEAQQLHVEESTFVKEKAIEEEELLDAEDYANLEGKTTNADMPLDEMAQNFFRRVDEIHEQFTDEEDNVVHFNDFS